MKALSVCNGVLSSSESFRRAAQRGLLLVAAAIGLLAWSASATRADSFVWSKPVTFGSSAEFDAGAGVFGGGGVGCASGAQCTAALDVGGNGDEATFNPVSPGSPPLAELPPSHSPGETICPALTLCVSVEADSAGYVTAFDQTETSGTTDATRVRIDPPTTFKLPNGDIEQYGETITGISCATVEVCAAVDIAGAEVTFNAGELQAGGAAAASPAVLMNVNNDSTAGGNDLEAVSCPTTTIAQCTAVGGEGGGEVTFDPSSATRGYQTASFVDVGGGRFFTGISCPSQTQCTAVGADGYETTFNPTLPSAEVFSTATSTTVDHTSNGTEANLLGVSCPSTSQCTVVDESGGEVTFNPTAPGAPTRTTIAQGTPLAGIDCPTTNECVVWNSGEESAALWVGISSGSSEPPSSGSSQSSGSGSSGSPSSGTSGSASSNSSSTGPSTTPGPPTIGGGGFPSTLLEGANIVITTGYVASCPAGGGACSATVTGELTTPVANASLARKKKSKTVNIGSSTVAIAAGGSSNLKLKLNSTGAKLLRSKHRLTIKLKITVDRSGAAPVAATKTITISEPTEHKRHKN